MAKELPYFQFEPAEYLTKDISFCSLPAQGLFINICSYYWQRECHLTETQILRRFNYPDLLKELIDEKVIRINDEQIKINFLFEQYYGIIKDKEDSSAKGRIGNLKRWNRPAYDRYANGEISLEEAFLIPKPSPPDELAIAKSSQIREEEIKEDNINSLFDSVFDSFLEMRVKLKKPMTGKAIELLKSKLEKLAPADEQTQIEILEQSIMNNWQGVFPLKDSAKKEGANGILLKDCDIDILPIKDIHRAKYRASIWFYNFFIKRAEKLKRKDDLDLLHSADIGVWMYDMDQIEKEHEFKEFDFFTIAIYLKEILYDEQVHFDIDSITSLKDLYGRYSNGKSKYLRISRDADKYVDKFQLYQFVGILRDRING